MGQKTHPRASGFLLLFTRKIAPLMVNSGRGRKIAKFRRTNYWRSELPHLIKHLQKQ